MKNIRGISLIILVITIIVILIIAGAIVLSLSKNNPITTASEASFKSSYIEYKNDLSLFLQGEYAKKSGNLDITSISATNTTGNYDGNKTITQIITGMSSSEAANYVIYKGKLVYIGSDINKKEWAKEIVNANPLVSDGLLLWLDGKDFTNSPQTNIWIDKSGNNNHATISSFAYNTTSGSDGNGGVVFDGNGDSATSSNFMKGITNFSIFVNFNTSQIASYTPSYIYNDPTICGLRQGSGISNDFVILNTNGYLSIYDELNGGSNNRITPIYISDGLNHNITITKNGTVLKVYYESALISTYTTGTSTLRDDIFIVGGRTWVGLDYSGTINSVLVYNRALTDSEVIQNYNNSGVQAQVSNTKIYGYTGSYSTFIAPQSGNYKFEAWGAPGGKSAGNAFTGGNGAYVCGETYLSKNQIVFVYVGGRGVDASGGTGGAGGFNGGGNGATDTTNYDAGSAGGGGATDFRLVSGNWNDTDSLRSRIMVAAGGASSGPYYAKGKGGAGGSLIGIKGEDVSPYVGGTGGTQTTGFLFGKGQDGTSGNESGAPGGGGYYGGYASPAANPGTTGTGGGGGGSSFISGYTGCDAINSSGVHTGTPNHYSGITFLNYSMIDGNSSMPSIFSGTMAGNALTGFAKITFLN